jgi:hypothetical protein
MVHLSAASVLVVLLALLVVGAAPAPSAHQEAAGLTSAAVAPSAPFVTAAPVSTTEITVTWSTPPGVVTNYTLDYARFYGLPIAFVNVVGKTVYNVTDLGYGLTYYFTIWAWNGSTEGVGSNVAAAQTNPLPPVVPPFPWQELEAITTLSFLASLAISAAMAAYVSGRRVRRAEGAAAIALARTNPPAERGRPPPRESYARVRGRSDRHLP